MSRAKIVVTIGPGTQTPQAIRALVDAGADLARLNGSHGDLTWHAQAIEAIRAVAPELPILFDVPGRKIRTGRLSDEPTFEAGDKIVLTTADGPYTHKVPVTSATLHEELSAGDTILADDGQLRFTVEAVVGQDVMCRVETAGRLRSAKGINVPGLTRQGPLVTERDEQMLTFAKDQGVDFVGISFAESAEHVQAVRAAIGQASPRIVSKVEHQRALERLDEILEASEAIMVDRGDLSVETGLQQVAILQKRILVAARRAGRPAIVATEMLHSMIENAIPTKAEVSDITNAVLDGAAAIMLSGETAIGRFPAQAVSIMRAIADAAAHELQTTLDDVIGPVTASVPQAMEDAIALICRRLPVTKIVAVTMGGYAARMVASRRPRQPILAVTNDPIAARSFQLLPGTQGVHVEVMFSRTSTDHIPRCLEILWRRRLLCDEDLVLVTSVGYPKSGNRMNLIETHVVADLRESLRWTH